MRPDDTEPWRLDRWLTLNAARPVAALRGARREPAIPVLMYHGVAPSLDTGPHPYLRTVTSPERFAEQMALLARLGRRPVRMSTAAQLLQRAAAGADDWRNTVVLSFDDGLRDFFVHARPVLARHGFAATVFLVSDCIGGDFVDGRPCLRGGEIRALADAGVEFGSHTASHPRLVELTEDRLHRELADSRDAIAQLTGRAVTQFAYPYRFPQEAPAFTRRLAAQLRECGYVAGVTTVIGRARPGDDPLFLPRLPVNDCDDTPLLAAKLAGDYDWLRPLQRLRKQLRALAPARSAA